MILSRRGVALAAVTVAAISACSGDDSATTDAEDDRSEIIATTSIWADITSEVLCGDVVPALIPAGADPHSFEPSLRDRASIEHARMIVANGSDLEGSLIELVLTAEGANLVEMTPHIDVIELDAHDDGNDGDDGHGHGLEADPHVWQDPSRVAGALGVIASAGTAIGRRDCSDEYATELLALDGDIAEILSDIPPAQRIMVTSHDALAYFADRYGFEIVGTVIPSTNTLAETNTADLAALADVIEERGVRAIFTEALESTADADALADRLGVDVVPLVTDALGDDPTTDTYVGMMRSNATLIAAALEP